MERIIQGQSRIYSFSLHTYDAFAFFFFFLIFLIFFLNTSMVHKVCFLFWLVVFSFFWGIWWGGSIFILNISLFEKQRFCWCKKVKFYKLRNSICMKPFLILQQPNNQINRLKILRCFRKMHANYL